MQTDSKPCVFVVEDDPMVVMLLEDLLEASGYRVLNAPCLGEGLRMVKTEAMDVAILDVTLGRVDSFPIADALLGRDIPFLFASGYGRESIPERFNGVDVLQKPYTMKGVKLALERLITGL